jgi:plasmid stabilization system protein ParE
VFRNHVVFYRYEAARDRVLISAIFDGRRDIAILLGTEHGGETDPSLY